MNDVIARRVANFDACESPGDFFLTESNPHDSGMRRLSFLCPCGGGHLAGVRIRADGQNDGQAWGWNKNEDKPTVTPSIAVNQCWHGYLTDGVFKSC
jgi:hypothetical protein